MVAPIATSCRKRPSPPLTPFRRCGFVRVVRRHRRRVLGGLAQGTPVGPPSLVQEGVWDVFDGRFPPAVSASETRLKSAKPQPTTPVRRSGVRFFEHLVHIGQRADGLFFNAAFDRGNALESGLVESAFDTALSDAAPFDDVVFFSRHSSSSIQDSHGRLLNNENVLFQVPSQPSMRAISHQKARPFW